MRHRTLAVALVAAVLAPLAPTSHEAANAATGKRRVMKCRSGNPTCWPTGFALTPNGKKILYIERFSGQIRVNRLTGKRRDRNWFTVSNLHVTAGETGLLGIALDPRWPKQKWVYVYYTQASPFRNRIDRIRRKGPGSFAQRKLITIKANSNHNGGALQFGPDGKLYAVTGDAGDPGRSQVRGNPSGKVLRLNKGGGKPADNPFGKSKAFSYGHRNSFGLTFDPETGSLWQTENGPECTDEINLVTSGGNYGWGAGSSCPNISTEGPNPIGPALAYSPTIAPTGATFCSGCGLGQVVEGRLLFGAFNDGEIRRLNLNGARDAITGQGVLYSNGRGILAMASSPKGPVFFSDNQGIYRLKP